MMLLLKPLLAWIVILYIVIIQGDLAVCKRVVVCRWRKRLIVGGIKAGVVKGSRTSGIWLFILSWWNSVVRY